MRLFKIYFIFLWTVSVSLFSTMIYVLNSCRQKCIINTSSMVNVVPRSTTDPPPYSRQLDQDGQILQPKKDTKIQINKPTKPCKVQPQQLQGRINFTTSLKADDIQNVKVIAKLSPGGVYKPKHCTSREPTAVIIPYRDRADHLAVLVNHLHNMLQRQQLHYGIYVVELELPSQFNRGLLANAGFLSARSIGNYTCYIIHDVDLVPVNDRNIYKCGNQPRHLVAKSNKYHNGLPYEGYVGGVIAMTQEQFVQVNGFSNAYFGWGGEDDDLYKRIESTNMTVERPATNVGVYMALEHKGDMTNPPNPNRKMLIYQAVNRMMQDGIDSAQYQRKAVEFRELYTYILVKCDEKEIMDNFPYLRANPDMMYKSSKKEQNDQLMIVKIENNKAENKFAFGRKKFKGHNI